MQKSFDLSRIKMLMLSRWRLLLLAAAIYAPVFLAGQAGVCLIPPKHLQEEDYLFLGLKWLSEREKNYHWRFNPQITTKEEALAFAEKYEECCKAGPGLVGYEGGLLRLLGVGWPSDLQATVFIDKMFGTKYHSVEIIFNNHGTMEEIPERSEYYNYSMSFTQCGTYVGSERVSEFHRPKWLKTPSK